MAKPLNRAISADSKPLQSLWDDWMPDSAAIAHIQQVVGRRQLAEEDLRVRLESGDVEAQYRWADPGYGINIRPMAPEEFKDPSILSRSGLPLPGGDIVFLRRADVYRIWRLRGVVDRPRQALPTRRPKGLGPKAWLAAQEVYELRREGGKWIDIEHDLLSQIQTRLGGNEWLRSPTTLKTAIAWLRRKRLIDL
jgi:hypothetical protein